MSALPGFLKLHAPLDDGELEEGCYSLRERSQERPREFVTERLSYMVDEKGEARQGRCSSGFRVIRWHRHGEKGERRIELREEK